MIYYIVRIEDFKKVEEKVSKNMFDANKIFDDFKTRVEVGKGCVGLLQIRKENSSKPIMKKVKQYPV